MDDDSFGRALEAARARVTAELDAQFASLLQQHAGAVVQARTDATTTADVRWSSVLESRNAEVAHEIEAAIAATRVESESRAAAAVATVQADAEHRIAEAMKRVPEAPQLAPVPAISSTLVAAFRSIESAGSLSEALSAIAGAAAEQMADCRLYVVNSDRFEPWPTEDQAVPPAASNNGSSTDSILRKAVSAREVVRTDGPAVAVPLLLEGSPVAVLYTAAGAGTDPASAPVEALEAIARYGSAHIGYITASRTAQARGWINRPETAPATPNEDAQSARRYARLLVSEIKLYNEATVRAGRDHRDLMRRLGPEVDRARRLYEERVPPTVAERAQHFHHELVQTLAGGDPSLLG